MEYSVGEFISDKYLVQSLIANEYAWELYAVLDCRINLLLFLKSFKSHMGSGTSQRHRRLKEGADAVINLFHENIMPTYAVGYNSRGSLYVILGYSSGASLKALLKKETQPPADDLLSIFIQVAEALAYAHQSNRIHGNLTPSSIWIDKVRDIYHAKVMNFEMDQLISENVPRNWFQAVNSAGLAEEALYASPEQCREGALSRQTDIYSLGCIMYEALTGRPPFSGTKLIEILCKHIEQNVPGFPTNKHVRLDLQRIILRCLSKNPSDRYLTAEELVLDLQAVRDGTSLKNPNIRRRGMELLKQVWKRLSSSKIGDFSARASFLRQNPSSISL